MMVNDLDSLMEKASGELMAMRYLAAETLCEQALLQSKERELWGYYARILLPLQECRRQRRMIAAEGIVQLGVLQWTAAPETGCVLLNQPITAEEADAMERQLRQEQRYVELLYSPGPLTGERWLIQAPRDVAIACEVPAPPSTWPRNQPILGSDRAAASHWFIAAGEALGDAALRQISAAPGTRERLEHLEASVAAVGDHEILHQQLAAAARALADRSSRG